MTPGRWLWHDDEQFEAVITRLEPLEPKDALEQLKVILDSWWVSQ